MADTPEDADVFETKLRDGDIVILYVRHFVSAHSGSWG